MSTLQTFAKTNNLTLATAQFAILKQTNQVAQIFLVNGIRLESVIVDHNENFLLLLDRKGKYNLINRKAISTSSSTGRTDEAVNVDLEGLLLEEFALQKLSLSTTNVFLLNGVRLTGKIEAFDNDSIFLSAFDKGMNSNNSQIIQLDSIASMCKADEVQHQSRY